MTKKKAEADKLPVGRPSTYTEAMADKICDELANGRALHQFCGKDGFPVERVVYQWLEKNPEFAHRYARAREEQADRYAAEIVTIADTATDANLARLKMDARKWAASKIAPKKYGDKTLTELTGADGGAIKTEATSKIDWRELDPDQRETLRQALLVAKGQG